MDNSAVKSQFGQILTAAKERRGDLAVDTMIVSSHLSQMRTFMLRRGIGAVLMQQLLNHHMQTFAVYESIASLIVDTKLHAVLERSNAAVFSRWLNAEENVFIFSL